MGELNNTKRRHGDRTCIMFVIIIISRGKEGKLYRVSIIPYRFNIDCAYPCCSGPIRLYKFKNFLDAPERIFPLYLKDERKKEIVYLIRC